MINKPPFTYYGGKQRIASKIVPFIPDHKVYAEPFCGAATILFAKKDYRTSNSNDYREAINDTNLDIYTFFQILKHDGKRLCKMLDLALYSQHEHSLARNYNGNDPFLRAYYFFINISQSFSKQYNGSWGTSRKSVLDTKTFTNKVKCLNEYIERMKSCYICCEDALRFIKRWDSLDTFFYCDPPYPDTRMDSYKGYTQKDFEKLVDLLGSIKGKFILSCYQNDAVPDKWVKREFETICTVSNTAAGGLRDKRTECIWMNYETI